MTNMPDDYALLNLGGLTSLIKNVKVSGWGTEVSFECIYDPTGERSPYVLVFEECREIKWNVHDPEEAEEAEADLFGIHLGKDAHRKPALIHTDIFEISLLYGNLRLQKAAVAKSE